MKILVLTGSPHLDGTTAFLANEFCVGAEEAGHEIIRFETGALKVHPCTACDHCRRNDGECVFDDGMAKIYPHLLSTDAVVLVTPLYYFGMSAQLKSVIDRFYAINSKLRENPKKMLLIAAGSEADDWAMDGLKAHFQCICRYLGWKEGDMVLALSAVTAEDVKDSEYQIMARNLGKGLQ